MELVLLELHVELILKDHQLEPVFVSLDLPATMEFALVVPQEPCGAQLPVDVSSFVDKIQPTQILPMLVYVIVDSDC
jgi:hypothetical protein